MRVLLLGPNGQVGWELRRALAPIGELVALGKETSNGLSGDLAAPEALGRSIDRLRPDVIVNAAAYTAVDRAEGESELARNINAVAPGVLAEATRRNGALLVHYSTDYVFDGRGDAPWREDDAPAPINVYGQTKLEGEEKVRESGCRHVIIRTSWVYASRGDNFIRTMLKLVAEQNSLQVIDDQTGAPTGADLIADVTAHVLRALEARPPAAGLYHVAAAGEVTWHGYASYIISEARAAGAPIRVADSAIERVSSDWFPMVATRPRNSRLDCTRVAREFNLSMPDWRDGVRRALHEIGPYTPGGPASQ